MIFQDPMTSLNPVFTIEKQMGEVLKLRFGMDREAARKRSAEMLTTVEAVTGFVLNWKSAWLDPAGIYI